MSSAYNRLKKYRHLKRLAEEQIISNDEYLAVVEPGQLNTVNHACDDLDSLHEFVNNNGFPSLLDSSSSENTNLNSDYSMSNYNEYILCSPSYSSLSNIEESSSEESDNAKTKKSVISLRKSLQSWAVKFRRNLTIEAVDGLLEVLRAEHIPDIPKSTAALLKTKSNKNIKLMMSSKNTNGTYVYFGVAEGLKGIISDEYSENKICLLFNVDGLPLFNNSSQQFWPIMGLILHNNYHSKPFIVSVYSGDSKPLSVNDFFNDFVLEMNELKQTGLTIEHRTFQIDIVGFTCDTPARSFIKKCKGHGGFYACERCETRGKTKNKKRVYPNVNSKRRTKRSFIKQHQKDHHLEGTSPLLNIFNFDPVKAVFLDSMHLLYLGTMKWMLHCWLGSKKRASRKCKISQSKKRSFNSSLKKCGKFIPKEFQRKKIDLDTISNWKATQFRFFLHYCGALALQNVLPKMMYNHFLLLVVACRILCDPDLCVRNVNYARELLTKFVELLPSFYGNDSQVMNNHNLIHLADDVEYTKMNLSSISAFEFENCLGKIKRIIVGKNNTLAQLVRRVSEQKACPETAKKNAIRKKRHLIVNPDIMCKNRTNFKSVIFHGVQLSTSKPNNIVSLESGEVFSITTIRKKRQKIFLYGFAFKTVTDVFKFPCKSTEVGIMKLEKLSKRKKMVLLENVFRKCVFFENGRHNYAVTFLHTS